MKRAIVISLGWFTYFWYVLTARSVYRGQQRFYRLAQEQRGSIGRAAAAVLTSAPARMAVDYTHYLDARDRDRISWIAATQYMEDETLLGYADETFTKGGDTLQEQQRGLILPTLERACASLPNGAKVVEIGTGNGDVLAHLAERFPELEFVGVDLSVAIADRKHSAANLEFVSGYALELLEAGELRGDAVFASSTFVVFTPLELARYADALAAAGFGRVILNEPTWAGYEQTPDGEAFSRHLEGATWHHNYAAYLRAAGYEPSAFSFEHYQPPTSPRPDVMVLILDAARPASRSADEG